jgi:hypothetical protein
MAAAAAAASSPNPLKGIKQEVSRIESNKMNVINNIAGILSVFN